MASGTFFKRPGVLLVLGLGVVGGLVSLAERVVSSRGSTEKRTVLADLSQSRNSSAFSPDGRRIAFCARPANGSQGDFRISMSEVAPGTSSGTALTRGVGSETSPAFSPDGKRLAFLRLNDEGAQAVLAPVGALGDASAERVMPLGWNSKDVDAERSKDRPTRAIAWTGDGKSLVVIEPPALALLAVDTGKLQRITSPGDEQADRSPAISPDGYHLAFVRGALGSEAGGEGADIYICGLGGGGLTRLTYDNDEIRGLDWGADGREVVYAAARGTGWHLWRIPAAGGSPREILSAGNAAGDPAIARAGNKLAFTEAPVTESIWRQRLDLEKAEAEKGDGGAPWIRTGASETYPSFSPDGRQVADISGQNGNQEVWLTNVETGGRTQVTNFRGPTLRGVRWSPDGKTLLIDERNGGAAIYAVAASARRGNPAPVHVTSGANASFSRDGKWIYYVAGANAAFTRDRQSTYYDGGGALFSARPDGSGVELVTGPPASGPEESADGKFVYFRRGRTIWRVPFAGGNAEEVVEPEHSLFGSSFAAVPDGLYYLEFDRSSRAVDLAFYRFSTSKSSEVLRMTDAGGSSGAGFTISPDGKTVLYPKIDRSQTNLVLIENFR
jgi:Tol biopolymer transport system component